MVLFGQIITGPPGAGKTTYCQGMQMFLESIGRKSAIINIDFANDQTPYDSYAGNVFFIIFEFSL
jgi:broad-specificity NMP kinase